MRKKLDHGRDERAPPKMAASAGFLASVEATGATVIEKITHTINTAPASIVLAEHDEYVRQLNADWDAMPAEFPYERSKRDKRKSKAKFAERKENLKKPSWKADLEDIGEMAEKLQENQKQWSNPEVMMKKVMAKMKKKKKEGKKDKEWCEKMLTSSWMTSGLHKQLRRTIDGWEEVDIEDDEAEAMLERKHLRKREIFPYNTWKWDELSSSDDAEACEARVVAVAIKLFEKPPDSDDEDDEPVMHSLFSDDEAIAADPPLRTKEDKTKEKAKKRERELIEKERKAREELRPLLHPFFKSDNRSADHILHAGALPVEVLKQSQFFPVSTDVRKAKTALYKQKYEEKMAVKAKKDKVKHNRTAKKQRHFEVRREKRSAYAHSLAVKGWNFPEEALAGYEDAIAKARIIPVVAPENSSKAPVRYRKAFFESNTIPPLTAEDSEPRDAEQLLPALPLAPEYARDAHWTFHEWDEEMAWTEYDTFPGRFEAISKIIKDDDWKDQFVKGSKLDQELMRTIVVPVWKAMTYEEKITVLSGQRVDPACFWSDDGDKDCSYVSGSPKMVDPFDIEGNDWVPWSDSSESDRSFINCAGSGQGKTIEPDLPSPARSALSTDKASFDQRERLVLEFLKAAMSSRSTERASSDEGETNEDGILLPVRTSLSTEKGRLDNEDLNRPCFLRSARSSRKGEKPSFIREEINDSNSLKPAASASTTHKESFNDEELHVSRAIIKTATTTEDSFGNSFQSPRSPSIPEKRSFQEGETNESDYWQFASFPSNAQSAGLNQEGVEESPSDAETLAGPEDSLESTAAFDNETAMPRSELESLVKVVYLSDLEESLVNPEPDLDLKMLFQKVGAFVTGEKVSEHPFSPSSSREAELIFCLLRKEAVVRHWFPERTFSYDNEAWKSRVSIFDPKNKEGLNPAVFPPIAKTICKDDEIEYSDPERMDVSILGCNNILQDRPDMQVNWIRIADEYRLGLNRRQRLTKPEWAKNYDLIRAQQPDPLIYMPKDSLEFDEVGYFSEVLPKPLVFPEVTEETKSYGDADWIWQKHCMDQQIGLQPCDRRSDPNAIISDEGYSGLIGDNLPPEDQSFDTNRSTRYKRSSGAPTEPLYSYGEPLNANGSMRAKRSSDALSFKMPDISEVPAAAAAQMLKELKELEKPRPETAALGRPPPEKYIQPYDTSAAVLMRIYQEEYDEFRKECPEPTSIRFEREVFLEPPVASEKKAKQELDDFLAQLSDEQLIRFSNEVDDALNELVAATHQDMPFLKSPTEPVEDFTSSVGSVRRNVDFKPKLKVDELDMKHAREDIPMAGSEPVTKRPHSPAAPRGSGAGTSGMNVISETLSRRSEKYHRRAVGHEKPSSRAPSILSAASGANLNRALDASKARILHKMKERGESAEKQASMAATLDMFKHPKPAVSEPEPVPESPLSFRNKDAKMKKAQPTKTPMTPAKARAIIDYLIDTAPTMEEDEIKENIIHFFGERFFAYAMTSLDLSPVDVSEEEASAYLQQRIEAHRLIEEAEEAQAKETKAKEIKSAEPMSKRVAQYLFEATMTPAKARALLDWAKYTQLSLYIKHMLAPGLLEYCGTELDAAPVAVTQEEGTRFIVWNRKMRESSQNSMELHVAARVDDVRISKDKSESKFGASPLISVAKDRALVEWLFKNRPDLEVMNLRHKEDLDCINHAKDGLPVQVTENEAIAFYNLVSKRVMNISCAQRDQEAQSKGADENSPLSEEETQKSNSDQGSLAPHEVDDPEDSSEFADTFENDPKMSPALAVQLIAWALDVRPDCDPKCVLGEHFIRYVSQYRGPELRPLEDDGAFPLFKKYALAQQFRTGRIKALNNYSEQKPYKKDDVCSEVFSHRSENEKSVIEKPPAIDPTFGPGNTSEMSALEKSPDIDIYSPPPPEKTLDTVRLLLKPSQVREFVEYLKATHGSCDLKDKAFDRMIKAYIQLPDSAPTKEFPFKGEALNLFKQMMMMQMIASRRRQRAFDEGRVAYAYGAGTDPDIRRELDEEVQDDEEEEFYHPYDDMYDGLARLFGSMSSIPRFDSPGGSFRGSFRGSFGSSGVSSTNEWPDLPSEVSSPVNRRSNGRLFIRKRLSHTFDSLPDVGSKDSGRLHLCRNPSYRTQQEADKNEERSSSPLMFASPGGFGLGLLPEDEQNENDQQSPTPAPRRSAKLPMREPASISSSPQSEGSDNPWKLLLAGRALQNMSATGTFSSRAGIVTPPLLRFESMSSSSSHDMWADWGTGSSASMTFSQFQAMRLNHRLEEANISRSFPSHGPNPFDKDVKADSAGRDEEDEVRSDMEAYEAWYNARHGVSVEELEEGRLYLEEEQMIDEMPNDPEILEKVLGVLAKIDAKVAEAHAEVVGKTRLEEEKQAALRGGVLSMVDDDSAHISLHALDLKKEFKKTLLKMVDSEHLDAEEIEILLEKIDERAEPSEYEWADANGEALEESVWEDGSEEESDIDQDYHAQEHEERMQLNFEQCQYEGALARVEAWRDAHEEHADRDFPKREREANEARKAEDKRTEAIVEAWDVSKTPLTLPNRKRRKHLQAKTLQKKEKASLGNAQNSQGPFTSAPEEAFPKKEETPLLKDQTSQGSVRSRRALERVSFQVTVEAEPLEAEQKAVFAETFIPRGEEISRLKSFESGGHGSKDADIRVPSSIHSLRSASDDASNDEVPRMKNPAAHLSLKSKDRDVDAPSPTPSIRSVSHGVPEMPSRKPSVDVAGPSTPSHEKFSLRSSMASSETAPRPLSLVQCMRTGNAFVEPPSTTKSFKARLGFKSTDLNTEAPSPTPSFRSVSHDLRRRSSKKLTKKHKPNAEDARLSTSSREIFSSTLSMAPNDNNPRPASLGQRMTSIFKRKDKEEANGTEESDSSEHDEKDEEFEV